MAGRPSSPPRLSGGLPRDADDETGVHSRAQPMPAGTLVQAFVARLLEEVTEAVVVLGSDDRIRWAVGGCEAIFGESHQQLRGATLLEFAPDDQRELVRSAVEEARRTGSKLQIGWHVERGGIVHQLVSTLVDRSSDTAIGGVVVSTRSVGRRGSAEALPDRQAFLRECERTWSDAGGYAMVVVEVTDFPTISSGLGHEPAERMLGAMGRRLRSSVDRHDVVGQVGPARFAVLLKEVTEDAPVLAVIERLRERLRLPFQVAGEEVVVAVATAFARIEPEPSTTPAALLCDAEATGHRIFGGPPRAFRPEMRAAYQRRIKIASALPRAIRRSEFQVHYQPIIRIADDSISGFEALVRWNDPELGAVSPAEFIPLAEELNWVVPLDRWMLNEACRHVIDWGAGLPFQLSVNISARHLDDTGLVQSVATALGASGFPRERLRLEITETAVSDDAMTSMDTLRRVKALGVSLAIDDFGAGHASFSHIAEMPFDILKVDRAFVSKLHEAHGRGIVHGIVSMAHELGKSVVAEGVETAEQLEALRDLGCDYAQGYFIRRPMTGLEARRYLLRPDR